MTLLALKRRLKGVLKKYRLIFIRWRYGFGADELAQALTKLGIKTGDRLMVHSSLDRLEGFTGKISDLIAVLQQAVGPSGLLLMPTLPFAGSALDWVRSNKPFDSQKTPSQSGLLTELFRRSPGVIRSVHPTHAVAAWGDQAETICQNHPTSRTPCGQGSPYAYLLADGWKLLFLGAGLESMTLFHAIEETLEPQMPISPFTQEQYQLQSKDSSGALLTTNTRLFNPELSKRRKIAKIIPYLHARPEQWRQTRLGNTPLLLLNAQDVLSAVTEMATKGQFCYDS